MKINNEKLKMLLITETEEKSYIMQIFCYMYRDKFNNN